jgi:hypothetical protein
MKLRIDDNENEDAGSDELLLLISTLNYCSDEQSNEIFFI